MIGIDYGNNRVAELDSSGNRITSWSATVTGIALAPNGNVYIADSMDDYIQEFTGTGIFLGQVGPAAQAMASSKIR